MTNKEKYPNACVKENPSATEECNGKWYILLSETVYQYKFLLRNLKIGPHDSNNPRNTYHPSQEAAQLALDNFMNENKPITLDEIKSQLSEAKKLIGKKVSLPKGFPFIVDGIILDIAGEKSSACCDRFFNEHGYVIKVCGGSNEIPYTSNLKPFEGVEVTNHCGGKYTAQDNGKTWKFGCAEISKELIKGLYKTIQLSPKNIGNRSVTKVTIGAADFSLDTLKALVDLEEENNRNSPL